MSPTQFARRRSRGLAAGLLVGLVVTVALSAPADAVVKPDGSRVAVMLENNDITFDPSNAVTTGWWGHEGGANNGTGTGATFLSMDGSDTAGTVDDKVAALMAAMGTDDTSKIGFVIVPTSVNGANEDPSVSSGQNVGQVFANGWIMGEGLGGSLNGTTGANDSVTTVSTLAQITAWVSALKPLQGYDSNLVLHDVSAPGQPVSTHPKGTSILDTWPAGTALSLVAYVTNGPDPVLGSAVPLVAADGSGKAKTAWLPFTTVAKPGDALRTSAGYVVTGAYAPTVSLSASFTNSTTATLTGTVKNKLNATATTATGTLEFVPVVSGVPQLGSVSSVPVVNGVASKSITGFTSGSSKVYDVRYVPDVAAQATYLTSAYARKTLFAPTATTTTLKITGGSTDTFTATVSPKVAGSVTFKNGSTTLGTAAVSTSTGIAKLVKGLTAGKHVITASFTPSSSTYAKSSATKTVWQPALTATLTPNHGRHGVRPKVTVKVVATGAVVSGKVTIVWDPPTGATKTFTITLSHGVGTLLLPKSVKGTTKVTVKYLGNTQILAANKALIFKAT